jgi:hypothetical protein
LLINNYNCMICWSWMLLLFYTLVYIPTRLHLVFQLLSSWVTALSWVWYGDFVFWVIEIMIIWWWSLRKGRQRDDSSSVVWYFMCISKQIEYFLTIQNQKSFHASTLLFQTVQVVFGTKDLSQKDCWFWNYLTQTT